MILHWRFHPIGYQLKYCNFIWVSHHEIETKRDPLVFATAILDHVNGHIIYNGHSINMCANSLTIYIR